MLSSTVSVVQFKTQRHQGHRFFILLLFALVFLQGSKLSADDDIAIKIRLQPRWDFGPLVQTTDRTAYDSIQDASLRRVRLEIVGRPRDRLHYIVAFAADRWDQQGKQPSVTLGYALLNYRFAPAINLQFGLTKLPYSRGLLASSSKLLLIDRAAIADLAGRFYKYFAPHLVLHGRRADGLLAYHLTLTDGLQTGDSDRAFSGQTVEGNGTPVAALRVELSPSGWVEKRKSDAHLGAGRHLSFGLNGVWQDDLKLTAISPERRLLLGADLSFHQESLSFGGEYIYMQRDGAARAETSGWYAQAGYYIKSRKIEPAVRIGLIDKDANIPDDRTRIFTGGLNWYIEAHALKFQANISHHRFDKNAREVTDKSSKTVLQLQNQIYF